MKPLIHKELGWFTFSIYEQLGNVGSEFERAARAFERGDQERFGRAFERMLELLDLTIEDPKWRTACRLWELLRLRERVCSVFYADEFNDEYVGGLKKCFLYFGIAGRAGR